MNYYFISDKKSKGQYLSFVRHEVTKKPIKFVDFDQAKSYLSSLRSNGDNVLMLKSYKNLDNNEE